MFGLSVRNDANAIQISSDSQYLTVHEEGNLAINGAYTTTVSFAQVATSQYPPLVFIRVLTASQGESTSFTARVLGVPGAWTGFVLRSGNTTQNNTLKWFAATYQPINTADTFGMKIWNEGGALCFHSGRPIIQFSRAITAWTVTSSSNQIYTYRSGKFLEANEYVMINQFITSHMAASTNGPSYFGVTVFASGEVGLTVNVGGAGPQTNLGYFPLLLAKRAL